MNWADFETERATIKKNVDEVRLSAKNVKPPQGSSRDQVDMVVSKQASVKDMRSALEAIISDNMVHPPELDDVSLSWDMPTIPPISKSFLRVRNESLSKIKGLRDSFSQNFRIRKDSASEDMAILGV